MAVGGDLPEDLVNNNILSWLPVKSLMRFKCVCKSWRSLFETPTFVSKHLNNNKDSRDRGDLFYKRVDRDSRKHFYALLSYETLDVIANLDFPYLQDDMIMNMNIAGCCDGIICAYYEYRAGIVLWNPATRELKILPQSHVSPPPCTDESAYSGPIGFGFDPKSNDYKVVHLVEYGTTNILKPPLYQAEVYDLSADSWRNSHAVMPPDAADAIRINSFGQLVPYVNGKFSWFAKDERRGHREIILSFDMSDEVFETTPLPDVCALQKLEYSRSLTVLHESLALINFPHPYSCYRGGKKYNVCEVWVLNEYGGVKEESWTKLYTFGPLVELQRPSGFWKNGHMFMDTISSGVALLNMITLQMKDLHFDNSILNLIVFYKESLIPLNGFSVYPLMAAMTFATSMCIFQLTRNMLMNPDVRINKAHRREAILDNREEGEKYAEHDLRKFLRTRPPEVMPTINHIFSDTN